MANIIIKRGRYYIQYRYLGKRKTVKTDLLVSGENLLKAEAMKEKIAEKVEVRNRDMKFRGLMGHMPGGFGVKDLTLDRAVEIYKLKLSLTSYSYQYRFKMAMNHLYKIVSPRIRVSKVTYEHSLQFVKYLKDRKLSVASIRTYYEHVKVLFAFLVDRKHLSQSPFSTDVLPRKTKKIVVPFHEDMLSNILSAAKEVETEFYNILNMLLLTGLRPKDLLKIKYGDIDLSAGFIYVHMTKTDKSIDMPISDACMAFIKSNMQHIIGMDRDQDIFPDYTVTILGRKFRRLKKKLGISERYVFTLKTFRKTFGSYYAEGLDIQDVSLLLGHDQISTTSSFYTRIKAESVRKKMNIFDAERSADGMAGRTVADQKNAEHEKSSVNT